MDARSRRKFVSSMMAATAAAMGGSAVFGAPGAPAPRQGRGGRPPHPRPAGIVWIPGIGIGPQKATAWDIREHTRLTMDNIKARVEALGGTMSDFLYMQVFYCLHLDDNTPMPTGSAAFAAYQRGYQDLNSVYNTYWKDTKYGAPPRSCFALAWIPGNSLIEIVGAAYIPSAAAPTA
jgi:enamine deaminase RidA (YjgF/YER057c/UK114 family)